MKQTKTQTSKKTTQRFHSGDAIDIRKYNFCWMHMKDSRKL